MNREPQDRPDAGEIAAFVRSFPEATFFHTPAWIDSLRAAFPRFEASWIAVREGAGLAGVMPIARIFRGPFYHLQAMPFGTYGDPLARNPAAREELFGRFFALARSARCLGAAIHLWSGEPPAALPRGAAVRREECRVASLEGGFEEAWSRASGKRRQLARRAERAGVTVRLLEGEEEIRRLYAVYVAEAKRWGGIHPYPQQLFLELWKRRDAGVSFFGAFLGAELLGGHIDFFYGGMAQAWQGGMTPQASEHEAGSLCVRAAMEEACRRGMRLFNLGASGGDRGIVFFKESLGGNERRYPVVTLTGAAGRLLRGRGTR